MKKILTIILALALVFALSAPAMATDPVDPDISTITASGTTTSAIVSGTTENGTTGEGTPERMLAVMVEILDANGVSVAMQSFPVDENAFSGSFTGLSLAASTTYTVRAANYDGGAWVTATFTTPAAPDPAPSTYTITAAAAARGTVTASAASAEAGATITVTASAEKSYRVSSVTAKQADGTAVELKQNAGGIYSFTMPAANVTISAVFTYSNPFKDVSDKAWYAQDVQYVNAAGLITGTDSDVFSPDDTTTRGMIVTILYRLRGEPNVVAANPFSDVAAGKYYEKAVIWASTNDIVTGYSTGSFGPEDPITREQLATILFRYAKYMGYSTVGTTELSKFSDSQSVSDYALAAMKWACSEGLVNGDGGRLLPQGYATRAQVAAILHRFNTIAK